MCGIIGQTGGSENATREAMRLLAYRGPDADGLFSDERVVLGHLRLSIIDVDARSDQPLAAADGNAVIVYNGEIYNFKELRDELSRVHGVRFRTQSDTEVLLEGYLKWGRELLPKLRGMFAFAIYDKKNSAVFLARDHAGIKPLYYSVANGKLYFASEAKAVAALLRADGVTPSISEHAIGLYLALGYVPSPLTLLNEVTKLPRGSWLSFDCSERTASIGNWTPAASAASDEKELAEMVRASVLEHTIADVPVGVFFSGGIDSSVIALTLRDAGIDLAPYSVLVEGRSADEPYFRKIASTLGVKANVHRFGLAEFEDTFEHVLSKMDDPIADPSIFPTAFISRVAAKDVKVVLSGEGGDELFLGYPRALAIARMHAKPDMPNLLDAAVLGVPPLRGKRAAIAKLAEALHMPVAYYLTQASLAFDHTPRAAWREAHAMLAHGDPLWLDRDWYLENMLLRKTDMATMFASIEGRVPLLGARLWSAAPEFAEMDASGLGKTVLRDMLRTALPDELIDRPKSGFGIPLTRLQRDSKVLRSATTDARTRLAAVHPFLAGACAAAEHRAPLAYGLVALDRSLRNLGCIM